MRQIILGVLLFFVGQTAIAQIESMYSMYQVNPLVISPAYAGVISNQAKGELVAINRQQWIGVQGSPRTAIFSGNFLLKAKIGVSGVFATDQAGPLRITNLSNDYSYSVKLNENWNMNGGLRLSMSSVYIDYAGLTAIDPNDPYIQINKSTGLKPNTGWGIHIVNRVGSFISVSQPRVLTYDFGNLSGAFKDVSYLYIQAGTAFSASKGIRLIPSIMVRTATSVPISCDANLVLNLSDRIDLGVVYRHKISYGARVGIPFSKKVYVTYTGEFPVAILNPIGVQTHELALRLSLFEKLK